MEENKHPAPFILEKRGIPWIKTFFYDFYMFIQLFLLYFICFTIVMVLLFLDKITHKNIFLEKFILLLEWIGNKGKNHHDI